MSDEEKSENPIEVPPAPVATLTITFDTRNGMTNVSFPQNEMLCVFMMKKAQQILDAEWARRNMPMVQPANGSAHQAARRLFG